LNFIIETECVLCEVNIQFNPLHANKGTEGRRIYSFDIFATTSLDVVCGQHHAAAALPPRKTLCPFYPMLGGLRACKKSLFPVFHSQTSNSYNKSLYLLLCPGRLLCEVGNEFSCAVYMNWKLQNVNIWYERFCQRWPYNFMQSDIWDWYV